MTVQPLHDRVLIKRIEEQETAKGESIPNTAKEMPQEGEVVTVGTSKTLENDSITPQEVKAWDRILLPGRVPRFLDRLQSVESVDEYFRVPDRGEKR